MTSTTHISSVVTCVLLLCSKEWFVTNLPNRNKRELFLILCHNKKCGMDLISTVSIKKGTAEP
jgi:hypothetical protein